MANPLAHLPNPLRPLVEQWKAVLRLAKKSKKELFDDDADECMKFLRGDQDFLWDPNNKRSLIANKDMAGESPQFQMVYNVAAELLQLFGPALYHKNPNRQVNAREPLDLPVDAFVDPGLQAQLQQLQQRIQKLQQQGQMPEVQQNPQFQMDLQNLQGQSQQIQAAIEQQQFSFSMLQAKMKARYGKDQVRSTLQQRYLNYTPVEFNLKRHMRDAIDEALIKGLGVMWTMTVQPPLSEITLVGSFYDSVQNFLQDPDAEQDEDILWIAQECVHPAWQIEEDYDLPRGSVKGSMESLNHQAATENKPEEGRENRRCGLTNDLVRYWKIYSKMGMGTKLKATREKRQFVETMGEVLDQVGDYCYLVVADNCDFFLNIPPQEESYSVDDVMMKVQWPIPFWADNDWPVSKLAFHRMPNCIWPMSHLRPALGEIRFVTWAMSFLANKLKTSSMDILAVIKSASEEIKDKLLKYDPSGFLRLEIESADGSKIGDVLSVLQLPQFKNDIFKVIESVMQMIRERLGTAEVAYGMSSRQPRSATEVTNKQQNYSVRPEDMAATVDEFGTEIARKEALTARWHLKPEDVEPILGEEGAALWGQIVMDGNISDLMREFEYTIEANTSRKPNQEMQAQNLQQAMTSLAPLLDEVRKQYGVNAPLNALVKMWCQSMGMPQSQIEPLMIPDIPPQPNPEVQKMQAELQMKQQEAQISQQVEQEKLAMEKESHQQEMQDRQQLHMATMQQRSDELRADRAEGAIELQQKVMETEVEVAAKKKLTALDLMLGRVKSEQQIKLGEEKLKMAKKQAAMKPKAKAGAK